MAAAAGCVAHPAMEAWLSDPERGDTRRAVYTKAVASALCRVCALRCAGCADTRILAGEGLAARDAGEAAPPTVCPMCLDTLTAIPSVVAATLEVYDNAGYVDDKQVTIDMTLPRCIPVRTAMWVHHVNAAVPEAARVAPRAVLDAKAILSGALADGVRARGKELALQNPDVTIAVVYVHDAADAELGPLWRRLGYKEARNYSKWGKAQSDPTWPAVRLIDEYLGGAGPTDIEAMGTPFGAPTNAAVRCPSVRRTPLLIAGRYLKYDREMPQSPWLIDGQRMGRSSVHEELARPMLPHIFPHGMERNCSMPKKARFDEADALIASIGNIKFHSAGREDIDVRMFGDGRPFMLEIPNPPVLNVASTAVEQMLTAVNSLDGPVEIVPGSMKTVAREYFNTLAEGSETKQKAYRMVVWVARAMTDEDLRKLERKEFVVEQKTPMRVLHRRTLSTRPKTVHELSVNRVINKHWLVLDITTQAGMYIKEFVNGDRGRTVPSLASICDCPADIIQLDVVNVFCDL